MPFTAIPKKIVMIVRSDTFIIHQINPFGTRGKEYFKSSLSVFLSLAFISINSHFGTEKIMLAAHRFRSYIYCFRFIRKNTSWNLYTFVVYRGMRKKDKNCVHTLPNNIINVFFTYLLF
mgnify:CR=1 FL=1